MICSADCICAQCIRAKLQIMNTHINVSPPLTLWNHLKCHIFIHTGQVGCPSHWNSALIRCLYLHCSWQGLSHKNKICESFPKLCLCMKFVHLCFAGALASPDGPAVKQLMVLLLNILLLQSAFGFQNTEQNQVDVSSWFSQMGRLRHRVEEWLHLHYFPQTPSPSRKYFCDQTTEDLPRSHSCLTPSLIFCLRTLMRGAVFAAVSRACTQTAKTEVMSTSVNGSWKALASCVYAPKVKCSVYA